MDSPFNARVSFVQVSTGAVPSGLMLADYKADVYSQTGEDGLIERVLASLPEKDRWCVEFGAWDGRHISNTRRLIEGGYSAVLIEGNASRFRNLRENYAHNPKVIALNRFVGFEADDNLDTILEKTPIPRGFDFLSIDVDGNDFHIWDALRNYRPKFVCIEFNPTIPNEVRFVQPRDLSINQGSSLSATVALGKEKGYELVSALQFNAFFVRVDYFPALGIADNRLETLRTDTSCITYLFSTFDGKLMLRGNRKLLWHGVNMDERRIQLLPAIFQKHPGAYGPLRRALFYLYLAVMQPGEVRRRLALRYKPIDV